MIVAIEPQLLTNPADSIHAPTNGPVFSSNSVDLHSGTFDGLDFMSYNTDFVSPGLAYQDMMTWAEFPMEIDSYISSTDLSRIPIVDTSDHADSASGSDVTGDSVFSSKPPHTRNSSIGSAARPDVQTTTPKQKTRSPSTDSSSPDFEAVLVSESAWPFVRCNPVIFSGACPRTAILHLESLEQIAKHEDAWKSLEVPMNRFDIGDQGFSVQPLTSGTRDKILAITQSFLHRAMEKHGGGANSSFGAQGIQNSRGFNFLVLPPSDVLQFFLRNYVHSLASYYSLVPSGSLDPNEMMLNNQASTLLVLLMIAQGATATPTKEARCLTAGLIETCRISLFDIIERDIELCADPVVLRCALLFTILGAWSGDKWHSDIIMGQRCMYMAVSI